MSAAPLEHFGNGVLKAWVEIPLPSPVGWSFEAPGWRLLLAAVLCLTVWQGWQMWRRWLADAYRRDGLAELDALRHDEPDWQRRLQRMPVIMKSVALHGFGRHQVAHLSGDA